MKRTLFLSLLLCSGTGLAQEQLAATSLDPMTVLGGASGTDRTVGSAHELDAAALRQFAHDDINRVLNWVPGLYIREEDGYGLRPNIGLRGANSDRSQKVTLLEDGVLFGPAPYAAPAAYFFPLTVRMRGVEVYKGPAAIAHGPQTIGGALNLLSHRVPQQRESLLSVTGGSEAYRRLYARSGGSLGAGRGGLLEIVHLGSQGFKQLDGGGDTGFSKTELNGKLRQNLGDGWLELRLGYAVEVSDETYLGLSEGDFRAEPLRRYRASALDRMDWDWNSQRLDLVQPVLGGQWHLSAYQHRLDRAWRKFNNLRDTDIRTVLANPEAPANRLRFGVLRGDIDSDPDFSGDDILIGTNDRAYRSSGVQSSLRWDLGTEWAHGIELGLRLHSDRIRRLHDEEAFEMQAGRLQRNAVPLAVTADNTARARALAVWLRDEISQGRWTLVPGLRYELVQTELVNRHATATNRDQQGILLPGLGLRFAWRPDLSLTAGLHRGYSPAAPSLNDGLEPEDALNAELGLRWRAAWGQLDLLAFHSDYDNLTAICTFSTGCADAQLGEQANAGRVRVLGLEAGWSGKYRLGEALSLPLELGYTWTEGEFRESFSSTNPQFGEVQAGFGLPYVPEHRANLRTGIEAAQGALYLSLSHVSAMRDAAGSGPITGGSDSHTVVDLAARWALTPALELNARLDNLLDREYVVARRPFGARPGKPLTAQLGLDYRF